MEPTLNLILHHGGRLSVAEDTGAVDYFGGQVCVWEDIECDTFNLFTLENLAKLHGYRKFKSIWWRNTQTDVEIELIKIDGDAHVRDMIIVSKYNGGDVEVYFDHDEMEPLEVILPPDDDVEILDVPMTNDERVAAEEVCSAEAVLPDSVLHGYAADIDAVMADIAGEEPDSSETDTDSEMGNAGSDESSDSENPSGAVVFDVPQTEWSCEEGSIDYHSEELRSPVSSDDEDDNGVKKFRFPQFTEGADFGNVVLELGMEFPDLKTFKKAVQDYTIERGRQIKWVKNDKERARAVCKVAECPWKILCCWSKPQKSFQIKTFDESHTCSRQFRNKQANRKWVSQKLEGRLRSQPTLSHHEAFDFMKETYGVHLDDTKIYRSLKAARKAVEGCEALQYGRLWDYIQELVRSNPGSTVMMDTTPITGSNPQFKRVYVCLDACKKGFKYGCRPLIGLDGCFLKGYYGGQLLSAVAQDANNQIFVIAYAVVDVEDKDNWFWFLTLLHKDLGDYKQHNWNFISDMQKGLIPAMQLVMPGVHHRFCVMHLWRNFAKQWKDKELKGAVWECARSTTVQEFNQHMERVKRKSENAWAYLNKWPKPAWTKSHFSETAKCDNICNNACEVFNAKILKYRGKPIITLLEEVRCYIMRTMANNKLKLRFQNGPLTPVQRSKLEKEKMLSNSWTPVWCGDGESQRYEVQHGSGTKVDVDLATASCTCRVWQLTGMPCKHAVAAIAYRNLKPEDYCHAWLTKGAYSSTYEYFVHPTLSHEFWEPTPYLKPIPPPARKKCGRPRKSRRKDSTESPSSGTKMRRTVAELHCSRCGLLNHNSRGCLNQGVQRRPRNWVDQEEEPNEDAQTEIQVSQGAPDNDILSQPTEPTTEQPTEPNEVPSTSVPVAHVPPTQASNAQVSGQPGPSVVRPRARAPLRRPRAAAGRGRPPLHPRAPLQPQPPMQPITPQQILPVIAPNATFQTAVRPFPIRSPVFRPPRSTNTPRPLQFTSSPPPGPVTYDLRGTEMTFMPTPSLPPRQDPGTNQDP